MAYEAATFDPSSAQTGQFNTNLPVNGRFVVYNESNIGLTLTFDDGETVYSPAGIAMIFRQPTPNPNVTWTQKNTLTGGGPISQVTVECYQPGEPIVGVFPLNIEHQTYIGNTVTTSQGSTLSIQNDGNLSGTQIVEATYSGSPQSNVFLDNAANFFLQQYVSGVLKKLFESVTGTTPFIYFQGRAVSIDQNGILTLGNQSAIVGKASDGTSGNLLGVDSSGNSFVQYNPKNKQFIVYNDTGANVATFDVNKCLKLTGSIQTSNGDTSGTLNIYEGIAGIYKIMLGVQNNYRQNGGAFQFTLKNAFSGPAFFFNGGCGGMQLVQAGTVQNLNCFATIAATGGTHTAETIAQQDTFGWCNTNFNQTGPSGGYASAHTGIFVVIGI